jgi:hypothetical protein
VALAPMSPRIRSRENIVGRCRVKSGSHTRAARASDASVGSKLGMSIRAGRSQQMERRWRRWRGFGLRKVRVHARVESLRACSHAGFGAVSAGVPRTSKLCSICRDRSDAPGGGGAVARENGAMWMQFCLPNRGRIKASFGGVTKRNDATAWKAFAIYS